MARWPLAGPRGTRGPFCFWCRMRARHRVCRKDVALSAVHCVALKYSHYTEKHTQSLPLHTDSLLSLGAHAASDMANAQATRDTQRNAQYHTPDANMTSLSVRHDRIDERGRRASALAQRTAAARSLLAIRTRIAHVRAPMQHNSAHDSSPHSPAAVLIAHLRKRTPEHM